MAQVVKNPPANAGEAGDAGLIPELGRFPREGRGIVCCLFRLDSFTKQYACEI